MSRRENEILIRHGEDLLPKILYYATAEKGERKSILNKSWFRKALEGKTCNIREGRDYKSFGLERATDKIDAYKALTQLEADAINDSTLVQEEIMDKIFEGAEPARCWRDVVPITTAESYSTRILKGESGYYASEVSEAGIIPIDTENYTKVDITIKKYGIRPVITNELIDDCQFDIVGRELKKAGAAMENKLNRVVLNEVLNGGSKITTNTSSPTGTHIAVSDLALSRSTIQKRNWPMVDKLVTHPTAEGYLLQDSNLAYVSYMGSNIPLMQGNIPTLFGLTPYTCTITDKATSPTWGDTTAGTSVSAILMASDDFGVLRMRQDLTVKNYDDPIHDIVGLSLLMRYGFKVINETAGSIIYHK